MTEDEYRIHVTDNKQLHKCHIETIAKAFEYSQRRAERRRAMKRRWWKRSRS